jgi:hypothetical protein
MALSKDQILHKNIIYTFVFGIIWGITEIVLYDLTESHNIFFKGIIFSSAAVFILMAAKKFTPYSLSLLAVAVIALAVKLSGQGFSLNVAAALFAQALIFEISLKVIRHKTAPVFAGGFVLLYSFIHSLIFHGSLPGSYIVYLYNSIFTSITGITTAKEYYYLILSFLGLVTFALGAAAGLISSRLIEIYQPKLDSRIDNYLLEP